MKYARGLAALLALAGCVSPAAADGISINGGLVLPRLRQGRLSVTVSGGFGLGCSPYACGLPSPAFGVVAIYQPPPPIFVPLPPVLPPFREGPLPDDFGGFQPRNQDDRQPVPPPLPERPKAPPQQPAPPAPKPKAVPAPEPLPRPAPRKEEPPKEEPPKEKPAEHKPAELPPAPLPEPEPKDESARQVALGRAAFAAGQYGRAAFRFRQAVVVAPGEALPHFLLAQTLFALGKYGEAVAEVHTGLLLQPDWPTRNFRPLELYGDEVADYPEHLARLEEALSRNPDDPDLLFLYAYELWFDGRQEEAVPVFQHAARVAPGKGDAERFLRDRPPGIPMV
jgi:hypothetical protein